MAVVQLSNAVPPWLCMLIGWLAFSAYVLHTAELNIAITLTSDAELSDEEAASLRRMDDTTAAEPDTGAECHSADIDGADLAAVTAVNSADSACGMSVSWTIWIGHLWLLLKIKFIFC